jgi:MraZ protein
LSFTGEYRHTIDAKGRLIVPSRLRDELPNDRKVFLGQYFTGCVGIWWGEGWARLEADLVNLKRSSPESRRWVRVFSSSVHQDEVDKQGRVTVPAALRDYAGIDRDVVVLGAIDHGELWSPERWEQEKALDEGGLDALAEHVDF